MPWHIVPCSSPKSAFLSTVLKLSACGRWTLPRLSLPAVRPLAGHTAGAHPCTPLRAPCVFASVGATRCAQRVLGGWPQPCNPERIDSIASGCAAKGGTGNLVPFLFVSLALVSPRYMRTDSLFLPPGPPSSPESSVLFTLLQSLEQKFFADNCQTEVPSVLKEQNRTELCWILFFLTLKVKK